MHVGVDHPGSGKGRGEAVQGGQERFPAGPVALRLGPGVAKLDAVGYLGGGKQALAAALGMADGRGDGHSGAPCRLGGGELPRSRRAPAGLETIEEPRGPIVFHDHARFPRDQVDRPPPVGFQEHGLAQPGAGRQQGAAWLGRG